MKVVAAHNRTPRIVKDPRTKKIIALKPQSTAVVLDQVLPRCFQKVTPDAARGYDDHSNAFLIELWNETPGIDALWEVEMENEMSARTPVGARWKELQRMFRQHGGVPLEFRDPSRVDWEGIADHGPQSERERMLAKKRRALEKRLERREKLLHGFSKHREQFIRELARLEMGP